jgi:predicted RNA-binding Zn ribbon-like protein
MVTPRGPRSRSSPLVRSEPDYRFDFCGGHLAIDFTNTVGHRGDPARRNEHFRSLADVLAWAEAAGLLDRRGVKALASELADPAAARAALARALALREALYAVLAARVRGAHPSPTALAVLNQYVQSIYGAASLVPAPGGFALATANAGGIDAVLAPIVRAAVDLLTSPAQNRVGLCADDACAWLFLDATRSGTRRWCDMKSCGNRSKVRRFRKSI